MAITLIDNYYCSGNNYLGANYGDFSGVTDYQKHNATNVYNYFIAQGWTSAAVCGMIGNMQIESSLNPAWIEVGGRRYAPDNASNVSTMTNTVMLNFYKAAHPEYTGTGNPFGMGLVQWTGPSSAGTVPYGQKLDSHAIRNCNNDPWYYGSVQLNRILWESQNNAQWVVKTINGVQWTWTNFIQCTDPQLAAHVWVACYERPNLTQTTINRRKENAQHWYDYFGSGPTPPPVPGDWITGSEFSGYALAYDPNITGVDIPYTSCDCIAFVNMVWRNIPVVASNNWNLINGTNSIWRNKYVSNPVSFNTTDPNNNTPTLELWYQDTIANCESMYGGIPTGALLFHEIPEAGPPAIPPQYAGDGYGNIAHVGIYCGDNIVMQSGGRDSSSVPGGGVHRSTYDPAAWSHVAFVCWVDTINTPPDPPGPDPQPDFNLAFWLLNNNNRKRKGVKNRVISKTIRAI